MLIGLGDDAVHHLQCCMFALVCVQVEASSARWGIGLVKLMGRQSGFIAVQASMASGAARIRSVAARVTPIWYGTAAAGRSPIAAASCLVGSAVAACITSRLLFHQQAVQRNAGGHGAE
jgi:hypothetical protein